MRTPRTHNHSWSFTGTKPSKRDCRRQAAHHKISQRQDRTFEDVQKPQENFACFFSTEKGWNKCRRRLLKLWWRRPFRLDGERVRSEVHSDKGGDGFRCSDYVWLYDLVILYWLEDKFGGQVCILFSRDAQDVWNQNMFIPWFIVRTDSWFFRQPPSRNATESNLDLGFQ